MDPKCILYIFSVHLMTFHNGHLFLKAGQTQRLKTNNKETQYVKQYSGLSLPQRIK